jgi:cytochrome c biogenesis protein CcmG, thiol:disulfide interchange protein DsbE
MNAWGRVAVAAVGLAVLILARNRLNIGGGGGAKMEAGGPAPNLQAFKVEGAWPDTTNKVVLLDFWATWCGPCQMSYPLLNEYHDKFKDRGLVVIGVSVDEDAGAMKEFVRKQGAKFLNVRDSAQSLSRAFNVTGIPRTVLIGADGKIAAQHVGFDPSGSRKEHIEEIEAALKAAGR